MAWHILSGFAIVQQLGDIAIILITHNEIHARLIADRFTFLSLGEVIGTGKAGDLAGDDIKKLIDTNNESIFLNFLYSSSLIKKSSVDFSK